MASPTKIPGVSRSSGTWKTSWSDRTNDKPRSQASVIEQCQWQVARESGFGRTSGAGFHTAAQGPIALMILDSPGLGAFQSEEPLNRRFPTVDEMAGLLTCLRAAAIAKLTVYRGFQAMSQAVNPGEGKKPANGTVDATFVQMHDDTFLKLVLVSCTCTSVWKYLHVGISVESVVGRTYDLRQIPKCAPLPCISIICIGTT
ncbi:hypothetical protein AOL_s00054g632 [Orbilia oligospora ATCC 24927]|uniref:Uncharacterized protein n=2 Tax=Orbilia oligospora TaxID=2813651 RepID=G1X6Y8_ARTOA|nr:hypothetical protein AOL_s00054g632 [Orbilia oligospora ATCC 24927]EGX51093.1 hypothetical protein AOL_s00054g632 [Orbilia oligospora ATCC 24927]KAF3273382.1 hypothetical protein TWF970_009164 [Orbilia oligospora]